MTSYKDSLEGPVSRQLLNNRSHLHFASQQPTIQRTHSLRQVDSSQPSFVPQINDLPFQIYHTRTKTEVSKLQIRQRLIDNHRQKTESLRAQKISRDDQTWKEYCTFQPSINAQSKTMASRLTKDKETHQRLYEEGVSKIKSLHECTHLLTESDKQNCTFRPNLNRKQAQNQGILAPLYQRLEQIISDKKEYLKRLQNEHQSEQVQEKPELSKHTKNIVENKTDFKKNVLDRLFSYMREKNDRLQRMVEEKEEKIDKQCTFQPELNYQSQAVQEGDFLERQQREAEKTREKMIYLQELSQAPFQPSINRLSALLIEAERAEETQEERLERLHRQPHLQRLAEMQKLQEECFKECTFQPQINLISRGLKGVPHQHRCACQPKEEQYHFHPQINPRSREMAQNPKQKEKEEVPAAEMVRMELEYREMKECTFQPKTMGNRFRSASQRTSLKQVKGAESYHLRIEKVRAKKKEDEQFKQKLFQIEKRYVGRKETKPEPFNLSAGVQKIDKLKEEAEEEFRKQYTFKPATANKVR